MSRVIEKNMEKMENKETILNLLKNTPVALTSAELRTRLRAKSLKLPEYEVTRVLRVLQSEEMVRLERGRWNITSTKIKTTIPTDTPQEGFRPTTNWTTPSTVSTPSEETPWTPGNSKILNRNLPPNVATNVEPKPIKFSGPWGTFRKLLNYYVDCIENDGGYEATGFLSDYGKRLIYLRQVGNWYPKVGRRWELNVPLSTHSQDFNNNASKLGEEGVLILGYPFHVWSSDEYVLVKPVFTYQLRFDFETNNLRVWCEDPWPEINLDWLTYAINNPEQQRAFLSACGLMDRGRGDEVLGDIDNIADQPDLQTLARGINYFISADQLCEKLLPSNVTSQSLQDKPRNGIYNKAVLMVGKRTRYTSSLLKELDRISKCSDEMLDKTALRFIFKAQKQIPKESKESDNQVDDNFQEKAHEGIVLDTCVLNGEQRRSVASLITEDLTVVTGPPGTGKSQVVAAAMANARLRDQTVLFTSRNHKAIDAVVERLNDRESLVARANSKDDSFNKFGFKEAVELLLRDERDHNTKERWDNVKRQFISLLDKRGQWGIEANMIQSLSDSLGYLEQQISSISEDWKSDMIAELDKEVHSFPSNDIRRLENIIGVLRFKGETVNLFTRLFWWFKSLMFCKKIKLIDQYLRKNCLSWQSATQKSGFLKLREIAIRMPLLLDAGKYCDLIKTAKLKEAELRDLPSLEVLATKINEVTEELKEITNEALGLDIVRRTGLPQEADREAFANLLSSLKRVNTPITNAALRKDTLSMLENNSPFLLNHFPLWAVTNLSIRSRIPLVNGLFELAIIDEASQCDIPSAIPILFRAKRVGVVGDPHQLSHVASIKRSRDTLLRERHEIININEQRFSYPDTSLYDLFAQTNGVNPTLLRETYRSVFDIAEYSNQNFYGGNLQVLTAADRLKIPRNMKPGIHWTEVASEIESAVRGCISPTEVDVVVDIVKKLIVENAFDGTVGIVTPFRQQTTRLIDALTPEIPLEIRDRVKLIIDTAHGFQGDERDVMIMSLCGGSTMPLGSLNFLRKDPNLMNVAVSRARAVLHIVGNKSWASNSGIPHIEKLTLPPRSPRDRYPHTKWYPHESPWEKKLFEALKSKGVEPEPQYPVLGRRLDLALVNKDKKIDIEVDGDRYHRNPDGTRKRDDVWRDIQMQGAEWKVMRFWVYQLRENMENCVNKISKAWR